MSGAFHKALSIGMLLAMVVALHACASRMSEPVLGDVFTPTDPHVINGEKVFMMHCQKCHPAGGEGGLGPSINSNPAPGFVKRFQMRHGLGVMPSFKVAEISMDDLHDVSKYLSAWNR